MSAKERQIDKHSLLSRKPINLKSKIRGQMQPQPCDSQQKSVYSRLSSSLGDQNPPLLPSSRIYHCVTPAVQMSLSISPTFRLTSQHGNFLLSLRTVQIMRPPYTSNSYSKSKATSTRTPNKPTTITRTQSNRKETACEMWHMLARSETVIMGCRGGDHSHMPPRFDGTHTLFPTVTQQLVQIQTEIKLKKYSTQSKQFKTVG
ncbi:hypothetical protein GGI42DRAFT_92336 [Trichoderma sp. SZMC 28013]